MASIHPYRRDCVEALTRAAAEGARAVKWLPAAQGMNPSSPLCDRFFEALAKLDLPLISHAGEERAVHGGNTQHFGNPLLLRQGTRSRRARGGRPLRLDGPGSRYRSRCERARMSTASISSPASWMMRRTGRNCMATSRR
ncbi:MAG: hypothetical protein M5R42_19030 [Rhodocyclaceae bacterium]|nr:hypothetical protein [Rhodocyclaceae bacterium]